MLTKREAAIITIFTGILIGDWSEAHKYAQELAGRPVWTHEFADKEFCEELKQLAKGEFIKIQTGDDLAAENARLKAKLDALTAISERDDRCYAQLKAKLDAVRAECEQSRQSGRRLSAPAVLDIIDKDGDDT